MKDVALYYPKMVLPQTGWLSRTLLYWDEVATIVPEAVQSEVGNNPYMAELIDLGLLRLVDPTPTLSESRVQNEVREAFFELQNAPAYDVYADTVGTSSMRAEKLLYSVLRQLEEQGRARRRDDGSGWLRVDSTVARWYMSLIAGLMASSLTVEGSARYKPITDDQRMDRTYTTELSPSVRNHYIYRSIHEVLPGPSMTIPPRQIVKFKELYSVELTNLRNWIHDEFLVAVSIPPSEMDLWESRIRARVADQVAFLIEEMERRKWPKVLLGTIGALFGNGLGLANSVVSSDSMLELGLGVGSASIAAGTSMPSVIESANHRRYDSRSPLAYAALTTKLRR